MSKHIVGQEGTEYMVLENVDGIWKVIARCPSKGSAEYIVVALESVTNMREERLSYGGR